MVEGEVCLFAKFGLLTVSFSLVFFNRSKTFSVFSGAIRSLKLRHTQYLRIIYLLLGSCQKKLQGSCPFSSFKEHFWSVQRIFFDLCSVNWRLFVSLFLGNRQTRHEAGNFCHRCESRTAIFASKDFYEREPADQKWMMRMMGLCREGFRKEEKEMVVYPIFNLALQKKNPTSAPEITQIQTHSLFRCVVHV